MFVMVWNVIGKMNHYGIVIVFFCISFLPLFALLALMYFSCVMPFPSFLPHAFVFQNLNQNAVEPNRNQSRSNLLTFLRTVRWCGNCLMIYSNS